MPKKYLDAIFGFLAGFVGRRFYERRNATKIQDDQKLQQMQQQQDQQDNPNQQKSTNP